ncbi:MAG: pilus assembly protein [Halothiobacillus sp. 13-55-253]|jgi:Tfp pilus assembly major pilin PilA|nr:MAG: pilus assembly protein [Halothiobacillus sp. 13-55-253]
MNKTLNTRRNNTRARQRGQGMTEYIIITALIAIAAIGAVMYFGQTARSQVAGMAKELSGQNANAEIADAGTAAGKAHDQEQKKKTLSSYNGNDN